MSQAPQILAVIPARGGSQGIPGKNLKLLGGQPLIAHTIEDARSSRLITRIIVSTDHAEIAAVARSFSAEVPFLRPPHLATQEARLHDVFAHLQNYLSETERYHYDYWITLLPTSPFRRHGIIDEALEKIISDPRAGWVYSLAPLSLPPHLAFYWENQRARYHPPPLAASSDAYYRINMSLMIERCPVAPSAPLRLCLKLTPIEAIDLDDPLDWEIAEAVISRRLFPEPEESVISIRNEGVPLGCE